MSSELGFMYCNGKIQKLIVAIHVVSSFCNEHCALEDGDSILKVSLLQGKLEGSLRLIELQESKQEKAQLSREQDSATLPRSIRSHSTYAMWESTSRVNVSSEIVTDAKAKLAKDGGDDQRILILSVVMYGFIGCLWLVKWTCYSVSDNKSILHTVMIALTWASLSIGMNVLNKSLSAQLKSPCLIATVQMLVAVITTVCTAFSELRKAFEHPEQLKMWLAVPALFSCQLISSFYTYSYISLSLFTVVRNLAPIVSLPLEGLLLSGTKPKVPALAAVLMMLLGALVYCGDVKEISRLGLVFATLNTMVCICDRLMQRRLLTTECKDISLPVCIFLNNFVGLFPTLAVAMATGEFQQASSNLARWMNPRVIFLLVLSAVVGISICYTGLVCQREITATSFLVMQNASKFGVVMMGVLIFADPIGSPLVALGLVLNLGGSALYGKAQLDPQNESATESPVTTVDDGAELSRAPNMTALAFLRLVASVHILFYHFHKVPGAVFPLYGSSWVPFFFALAGMGATHSKLSKATYSGSSAMTLHLLPRPRTLLRRLATVYPLYSLSVISEATLNVVRDGYLLDRAQLGVELALLQTWMPSKYITHAFNLPGWFISTLAGFWLVEEAAFMAVSTLWHINASLVIVISCAVWVCGIMSLVAFPRMVGGFLLTSMPFFHYLPSYLSGIVVAFVLHDRACRGCPPLRFGASICILLLVIVFQLHLGNDTFIDIWFKKAGILLPVHCLLMLGLSEGQDVVAKVFSAWPLRLSQDVAFGVYILQAPVAKFLFHWAGTPLTLSQMAVLVLVLLPTAAVAQGIFGRIAAYAKDCDRTSKL